METIAKDIYKSVERFSRAVERLRTDNRLPVHNRKLAYDWILLKQKEMRNGLTLQEQAEADIRHTKTLNKYCTILTNVCYWFPDLRRITKKELEQFKDGFNLDKIKSITGKAIKDKTDFYNKVIRSHFFKKYLGHEAIVTSVFDFKQQRRETEVEFITIDDLKEMLEHTTAPYQRVALTVLFCTGMRVGTLLNVRKRDFEIKHNPKTRMSYYLCHIKKEYTKSKSNNTIQIIMPECNELLKNYLDKLQQDDYILPYSYSQIRKVILQTSQMAKVTTKPNNKAPHIHILRHSTPMYLLNLGYTTDQVKRVLCHKPSSTVIDKYVNYLGLDMEKQDTKVQMDEYIKVQDEQKQTKAQMIALQGEYDRQKKDIEDMRNMIKNLVIRQAEERVKRQS